ncbi:uncharacterized protein LOC134283956 [Aedes albopictus]|uniref:Secreted protein n=1 Tax=Aedes albopictus TaxID=7160 RepID=A0ABM1ZPQ4_AEDAL
MPSSTKGLTSVLMLLVLSGTVCGDFGLNITVPNLVTNVTSAVGSGIVPLVKADASIGSEVVQDGSGAVVVLIDSIKDIIYPLNKLLGHVLAAVRSKNKDSKVIFSELDKLSDETKMALETAAVSVGGLENVTKPAILAQMQDNVTELSENVDNVKSSLASLSSAVEEVRNSMEPITSENVSSIITPDMVDNLANPLRMISTDLNDISTLTMMVVMAEKFAIDNRKQVANSLASKQKTFKAIALDGLMRSISDVNNNIESMASNLKNNVKQTYTPLVNQQQDDQRTLSTLSVYLDTLENSTTNFVQSTNESLVTLFDFTNQTLVNQSLLIGEMIMQAAANLTNLGLVSDSPNTERCVQQYGSQLSLPSVSPTKLSQCTLSEGGTPSAVLQATRVLMNQAKTTAISVANGIQVCQQSSGTCNEMYLSSLENFAEQASGQMNNIASVVEQLAQIVSKRMELCALATTIGIGENIEFIGNKFDACLMTGQ